MKRSRDDLQIDLALDDPAALLHECSRCGDPVLSRAEHDLVCEACDSDLRRLRWALGHQPHLDFAHGVLVTAAIVVGWTLVWLAVAWLWS